MAWLIGIVCVIVVIAYWRVFLPLAIVALLILGVIIWNESYQQNKRQEKAKIATDLFKEKLRTAKQKETSEGKKWELYYEEDPANKIPIARTAYLKSNDELCSLSVQKRLNGSNLTGISCPGIKISEYDDIEVKFDTAETSQKMRLEKYADSEEVYIPSYQYSYSGQLNYEDFIKILKNSKSLAIKIPALENFWTTFNIQNSSKVITSLGKTKIEIDKNE